MVRAPAIFSLPAPAGSIFFDLKVMVGYFCTSKKLGLRRSLSRISTRVSTEAASMLAVIWSLAGLASSTTMVPLTLVKAPRTVEIPRWRTENCADECMGSICQVSCAAAVTVAARIRKSAMTSADRVRGILRSWRGFVLSLYSVAGDGLRVAGFGLQLSGFGSLEWGRSALPSLGRARRPSPHGSCRD